MRRGTISFLLVSLFVLICTVKVASQEQDQELSAITVKSHEANKALVFVSIVKDGKAYDLTCNVGFPGCNDLEPGKYKMIELPKNHGTYDCRNVEIYPDSIEEADEEKVLGNYCMTEKPTPKR